MWFSRLLESHSRWTRSGLDGSSQGELQHSKGRLAHRDMILDTWGVQDHILDTPCYLGCSMGCSKLWKSADVQTWICTSALFHSLYPCEFICKIETCLNFLFKVCILLIIKFITSFLCVWDVTRQWEASSILHSQKPSWLPWIHEPNSVAPCFMLHQNEANCLLLITDHAVRLFK